MASRIGILSKTERADTMSPALMNPDTTVFHDTTFLSGIASNN